uniref:Uncharacterized protein n=1 Tax=viral metagenome TaxID=1070528 RepID=A0A6M3Y2J1_9ZZZZ
MALASCKLGVKKPDICKHFPETAVEIKDFPSCSFYWLEGIRRGKCNRCGQCCVEMRFGDKKYAICPYRKWRK